jgi:hypothetical protein
MTSATLSEAARREPLAAIHGEDAVRRQRHIEDVLATVTQALASIRFGAIELTVHDDRVVQIDVTEKRRPIY